MQIADGDAAFWEYWHNHTLQKTENGHSAKAKQVRSLTVFLEKSQCTILSFTHLTYLPTFEIRNSKWNEIASFNIFAENHLIIREEREGGDGVKFHVSEETFRSTGPGLEHQTFRSQARHLKHCTTTLPHHCITSPHRSSTALRDIHNRNTNTIHHTSTPQP